MSFFEGAIREGPWIYQRISRRDFWPGSARRRHRFLRHYTIADAIACEIPIRELRKLRPIAPWRSFRFQVDGAGDSLHPRPRQRK